MGVSVGVGVGVRMGVGVGIRVGVGVDVGAAAGAQEVSTKDSSIKELKISQIIFFCIFLLPSFLAL